jgi:cellulose biosynthesis protein BcsQ
VIDMDPQGNASTALGVDHREGTPSSYDLLMWEASVDELMQKSPHAERLFCVPATIDLAGSEIELVGLPNASAGWRRFSIPRICCHWASTTFSSIARHPSDCLP